MQNEVSFRLFIFRHPWYLWGTASLIVLTLLMFKLLFPYPNMDFDSHHYVMAAFRNEKIGIWPTGYSRFLQICHWITPSALFLVVVQYLLLESACLFFFFTFLYFFRPGKFGTSLLFLFLFVNPIFLYCCNFVLSDALFISLSLIWVTQLLWVLWAPRPWLLLTQVLVVYAALSIRYEALYYPFVSLLCIFFCRFRAWLKVAGLALTIGLPALFFWHTSRLVKEVSGERMVSPFAGWKLANDALYVYAQTYQQPGEVIPDRLAPLDRQVRKYFDSTPKTDDLLDYDSRSAGSFYIFLPQSPLNVYMNSHYTEGNDMIKWYKVSDLYAAYGSYLMRQYPAGFLRYFVGPNLIRYAIPPTENFTLPETFFDSHDYMGYVSARWFNLEHMFVNQTYSIALMQLTRLYSKLTGLIHLAFILGCIGILFSKDFQKMSGTAKRITLLIMILWLFDFFFSLTAAAVVLRHVLFIQILEMAFAVYFLERVYHSSQLSQP